MISRRNFLSGVCAAALILETGSAQARFPHGSGPNNLLTAKSLISGFDLNEGTSYAFLNFAKGMTTLGAASSFNFAKFMNSDGYPNALYTGQSSGFGSSNGMDASLVDPSITWVLDWQGVGGIQIANGTINGNPNFTITNLGAGTSVSGAGAPPSTITNVMIASGTNGYVEFTNGAGASQYGLNFSQFVTYDGTMSNLRLYRKTDKAALLAGAIFTPEFISYMKTMNPKIIRTMDWTSTNASNLSSYAVRCQTTAFSYLNASFYSALYAGDAAGTNTYTCSAPPGWAGLVDGATVQVRFLNANSSTTPTLAVGGTAATTLVTMTNAPLDTNPATAPATSIAANCQATLVYDAWLNVWVCNLGQPANNNAGGGLTSTMPWEIQVALCNQLNMHLWVCIPFYYTDAAVSALASYISGALNSNLKCYFEYTNEHWNFGMTQFAMCQAKGAYLGFPNTSGRRENGYYGLRVRQIMTLVTAAWAPRSTATLRRVMAVGSQATDPVSGQLYQLNGADLDTTLGYTNYNSKIAASFNVGSPTFSRPIDGCDVFSYANYYAGAILNNGGSYTTAELSAADITALTNAADTNDLSWVDNQFRKGTRNTVTCALPSSIATNTISVTNRFVNVAGDNSHVVIMSSSGAMPTGLVANTIYYAVNQTGTTFQVSATNGGSPLTISGGTGTLTIGSLGSETLLWFSTLVYPAWEPVCASYDGVRPAGFSNLVVECYEGALEALPPTNNTSSVNQCAALGIANSYGSLTGSIATLLTNYKNDARAKQLVQDQFTQFSGASARNITPAWFSPFGPNQWALTPGSVLTTPYQTYQGIANYNSH